MMRSIRLLVLAVVTACPAHAVADWKADRAALVAAAEKEGALVIFIQPNRTARSFTEKEWAKEFPRIRLSLTTMTANQFVTRIKTERQSGKFLWDLGFTGNPSANELYPAGILDPILPELVDPDVNKPEIWGGWGEALVDIPKKFVFSMHATLKSPIFNPARLSPEKVEKLGMRVLLEPELQGRIVWHDPTVSGPGQAFAYSLRKRLGDELLRKFIVGQRVRFVAHQQEVIDALARETAWLGLGPANADSLIEEYRKAGIKVKLQAFGNSPELSDITIGGSNLFVFTRRPHPNASRLFINWLLSRDVQDRFARANGGNSRRRDVAAITEKERTPIPGANYISPQREEFEEPLRESIKLVDEIRRSM